jgi:hypothetical protein
MTPVGRPIACGECGSRYEIEAWSSLAFVTCIAPQEVRRFLADGAEEFCIEVRCCQRCRREIASAREWAGP